MKRCSILRAIRKFTPKPEGGIQTQWSAYNQQDRLITSAKEDLETPEPSYNVSNGTAALENSLAILQKVKHLGNVWFPKDKAIQLLYQREMKTQMSIQKLVCEYSALLKIAKGWKQLRHPSTTQHPSMNEQNVVFPYNGILFSYKRK